jgi:hypothetical protein
MITEMQARETDERARRDPDSSCRGDDQSQHQDVQLPVQKALSDISWISLNGSS